MAEETRRKWPTQLGSALSFLAICGFVITAAWAKYSPVQADEVARPAAQKKDAKAKKKAKAAPAAETPAPRQVVPMGAKLDVAALAKLIDQEVNRQLQEQKVNPSAKSDDAEFLRRIYLDLVGVIPTAEKAKEFLDSTDPNKRGKLIDELLADARFGKWMSEQWSGLMLPRESNNRRLDHTPMQKWLANHFNQNTPLDKMVYDLVTSTGTQDENGAVTYFVGNPTVDKITDSVSKMFLGVQLQCAQCHNHPFTDWKQDEYWGMAQFFMKVRLTVNPQQAAKKGVSPGITENPQVKAKKGMLPESAKVVPAKFLQGEQPPVKATEPARPIIAKWMTSADNPFFARAMANRLWYQVFGRGLVNPVDDMHKDNPASHPELLDALTAQLKANGFDTKYLIRAICNSEAYQRSSKPTADNASDTDLYSHRVVRVLAPEQLFDSLTQVIGVNPKAKEDRAAKAAVLKKGPNGPRDQFLTFFRIEEGADPLEYQHGIPQALRLMNSPLLNVTAGVGRAMLEAKTPPAVLERLYLTALSRRPTQQETERMLRHVREAPDARTGYGDVMWALLNSSEFALNR